MTQDSSHEQSSETHYPWDLPEYNKIARFFSALKESRIETTKCNKCGSVQWPPRSVCSNCLCDDLSWIEIPKSGTIVGFSRAYIGTIHGEEPPMLVAAVHLDDGLRLLTRIVNARYEQLKVGTRVRLSKASLINGKPYWAFVPE